MLRHRSVLVILFLLVASFFCFAFDNKADLPKRAIEKSQLTLPGSQPFHLKAEIVEATNLENDSYKATVEEYWLAPDKWRRTVKAENFSQTLIVHGDKTHEEITGDYYPNWLRTLVTAIFDPGSNLEGVDLTKSSDNPVFGGSQFCRRFSFHAGIPPVGNTVFSTFCFEGDKLASIARPGFHAEYKDYKKFAGKEVSHRVREYIESGTELEAKITELNELTSPDEAMFAVSENSKPLQTIVVSEDTLRKLAPSDLALDWPSVKAGKTEGVLSVYICLDREGKVNEAYGLNSDHPAMTDAAIAQLSKLKFKTANFHGDIVQVEGILTFAYKTKIENPNPELSDDEARKLVEHWEEPRFPPDFRKGTILTMHIDVGDDGKVHQYGPMSGPNAPRVFIYFGIKNWKFRLPEKDGKPTPFSATLKFVVL